MPAHHYSTNLLHTSACRPQCKPGPFTACFCTLTRPYSVPLRPNGSGHLRDKPFPVKYPKHAPSRVHSTRTYLPIKMEQTECSETSAYKIQTPENNQKESIHYSQLVPLNCNKQSNDCFFNPLSTTGDRILRKRVSYSNLPLTFVDMNSRTTQLSQNLINGRKTICTDCVANFIKIFIISAS